MGAARAFALALLALASAHGASASREVVDDAGRTVTLPDRIERVYAAGPPASVLVFAIAPDKLIGWTRHFRDDEAHWVPEKYAKLPELGRLTGRSNTANVEVVLKEKPDVIIDVGATNATFASLADRVQSQTGIPYVLLDGRLQTTPLQIEKIASILGTPERGRELSAYASRILGATRLQSLWQITAPLLRTGVIATWCFIFIGVMRELSAAIVLFTSQTKVLSVLIYDLNESGDLAAISVLGIAMLIITFAVVLAVNQIPVFGANAGARPRN